MSQIAKKHLLAGIIFGDAETGEYIYLPGGEVGTDQPLCVFEHDGQKEDVDLDRAGYLVDHLTLKKLQPPHLRQAVVLMGRTPPPLSAPLRRGAGAAGV